MFNTITMQQHNATRETPKENDHNLCYIFGYNYNLNAFMSQNYGEVHGYICLVICIFGAISNLLNIIVLTRKEMNGSPINRILSGTYVCMQQANMFNITTGIPRSPADGWKGQLVGSLLVGSAVSHIITPIFFIIKIQVWPLLTLPQYWNTYPSQPIPS